MSVRRFVEKKTSEFYAAFNAEINVVKKLFDAVRRVPPKSPILPKYAGTARCAPLKVFPLLDCNLVRLRGIVPLQAQEPTQMVQQAKIPEISKWCGKPKYPKYPLASMPTFFSFSCSSCCVVVHKCHLPLTQ
eukprot:1159301-Pelagomonas_calceolata.AAC.3